MHVLIGVLGCHREDGRACLNEGNQEFAVDHLGGEMFLGAFLKEQPLSGDVQVVLCNVDRSKVLDEIIYFSQRQLVVSLRDLDDELQDLASHHLVN